MQVCFMSISNLLRLIPPSPCNEISLEQGQRWHARNKNIIGAGVIWGKSVMSEKPSSLCEVTGATGLALRRILWGWMAGQ